MKKHLKVLKEAFDYNQTDKVILIDDGTVFLPQAKNLAVDYARKKGLKWKMVTRKAIEQTKPVTGGTDNPDGKKQMLPAPAEPKAAQQRKRPEKNKPV